MVPADADGFRTDFDRQIVPDCLHRDWEFFSFVQLVSEVAITGFSRKV
jgi:hypothetical protein